MKLRLSYGSIMSCNNLVALRYTWIHHFRGSSHRGLDVETTFEARHNRGRSRVEDSIVLQRIVEMLMFVKKWARFWVGWISNKRDSANSCLPYIPADGHPRLVLLDEDTSISFDSLFWTSSIRKAKWFFSSQRRWVVGENFSVKRMWAAPIHAISMSIPFYHFKMFNDNYDIDVCKSGFGKLWVLIPTGLKISTE